MFDLYKWGARGNRPESLPVCPRIGSFNPHLCTGGDPVDSLMAMGYPYFNPRPPHRGRQQKQPKQNPRFPLNPAPPPNPHPPKHHPQDLPLALPPYPPENPVRSPCDSLRASPSHLQYQNILRVVSRLGAEMLDLVFVPAPQVIKAQAVFFRVHDLAEFCL